MPKGSCLEQVEEENQGGSPGNSCVSNVLVGLWPWWYLTVDVSWSLDFQNPRH